MKKILFTNATEFKNELMKDESFETAFNKFCFGSERIPEDDENVYLLYDPFNNLFCYGSTNIKENELETKYINYWYDNFNCDSSQDSKTLACLFEATYPDLYDETYPDFEAQEKYLEEIIVNLMEEYNLIIQEYLRCKFTERDEFIEFAITKDDSKAYMIIDQNSFIYGEETFIDFGKKDSITSNDYITERLFYERKYNEYIDIYEEYIEEHCLAGISFLDWLDNDEDSLYTPFDYTFDYMVEFNCSIDEDGNIITDFYEEENNSYSFREAVQILIKEENCLEYSSIN